MQAIVLLMIRSAIYSNIFLFLPSSQNEEMLEKFVGDRVAFKLIDYVHA